MARWPETVSTASASAASANTVCAPTMTVAPARAVDDRAAEQPEDEHRQVAAEADRAEHRGRARHVVDEPAERDLLHPDADVRDERAGPEEQVVAGAERAQHACEITTRSGSGANVAGRCSWSARLSDSRPRRRSRSPARPPRSTARSARSSARASGVRSSGMRSPSPATSVPRSFSRMKLLPGLPGIDAQLAGGRGDGVRRRHADQARVGLARARATSGARLGDVVAGGARAASA